MSGTTAAPYCGLLQPVAVPAAIEASAPVPWPLHLRLVFERMVQPESATFGAPLKVSDWSETGCPVPSVVSGREREYHEQGRQHHGDGAEYQDRTGASLAAGEPAAHGLSNTAAALACTVGAGRSAPNGSGTGTRAETSTVTASSPIWT